MLKSFVERFVLGGYEAAKEIALATIIGRFARGNTAVQDRRTIDEEGMDQLYREAEPALRRLKKLRERITAPSA